MSGSTLQTAKGNSSVDEVPKGADALEKPCLGQPFQLGMLYDCRSDSLIPGVTLWGSQALSTAVSVKPLETSDFEVIAEDSLSEKATHVGADASLKLSILGGMVKVEGAAKFLMDQKTSKKQARVSLKYKSTTRFEQLTMDQLGNFEYTDIFDKNVATHVVTGMVYGADAFFVFDREVAIDEDIKEIHGSLKVKVGGLPGLENLAIEGQASLDLSQTDKTEEEKLHCKFYGDLILPKHPTTYRDAAKVYQELPEFLKGKSVPKKVWLYPLGLLDSRAERMVREISSRLIDELHILMECLHDIIMRSNDLIRTEVCSNFLGLKEELEKIKGLVSGYRADLQKSLATMLPKVRGGGTGEADIAEILKTNSLSPFCPLSLSTWVSGKENEVKILSGYLKHLKQEQIKLAFEPGEVDVFINDLDIDTVFCLDFGVTWGKDAQLLKMEAYLQNKEVSPEGFSGQLPQVWYKNQAFMREMRLQIRSFRDFANINHTAAGVKFVVTNSDSFDSTDPKFVSLYESGYQSMFEPPGPPGKPKANGVNHAGLELAWDKPKYGVSSIQSYIVSYQSSDDAKDQWCTEKTTTNKQQLVLSGLVPGKLYSFKIRAVTHVGLGPEGDECRIRLPPDQPGKPCASEVTHISLRLKWIKPKYGADIVESYTISYCVSTAPQNQWTIHKTSDKQEFADLSGFSAKTVYIFKVRAESEAGAGPDSELSDPIEMKTMPWGAKVCNGLNPISSNPPTYLLPTHCALKKKDVLKVHVGVSNEPSTGEVIENCSCHKRTQSGVQHKVLMVVGATGAGKTTLINGMANYIMGVQWDDDFRFKLVAESTAKDPTKSQTMAITAYTFYKDNDSPLPYTLTVIDTPGFGASGGLARDKYIVSQIKELFSLEGINEIHGIGIVTQAPLARLTPTQRYVFDAILAVFGKDVAGNIFLMITADGMRPPVLDAVKVAGVPENAFFKFNNSALYASKSADYEFDRMVWRMGTKSFDDFFSHFSTAETQSLTLSREVIQVRERLETNIPAVPPSNVLKLISNQITCTTSIERLKQIALKPNHLTEVEYIDLLIESEKREARARWHERVQALEQVRKKAEFLTSLIH